MKHDGSAMSKTKHASYSGAVVANLCCMFLLAMIRFPAPYATTKAGTILATFVYALSFLCALHVATKLIERIFNELAPLDESGRGAVLAWCGGKDIAWWAALIGSGTGELIARHALGSTSLLLRSVTGLGGAAIIAGATAAALADICFRSLSGRLGRS